MSYVYHETVAAAASLSRPEDPRQPVHLALSRIRHLQGYLHSGPRRTHARPWNAADEPSRDRDRPADEGAAHAGRRGGRRTGRPRCRGRLSGRQAGFTALLVTAPGRDDTPTSSSKHPTDWYFSTSTPDAGNRVAVTLEEKPTGARRSRVLHPDVGGRRKVHREHSRARRRRQAALGKRHFVISHVGEFR